MNLQLAKESFLERLKREREENCNGTETNKNVTPVKTNLPLENNFPTSGSKKTFNNTSYHSNSCSESEEEAKITKNGSFSVQKTKQTISYQSTETSDETNERNKRSVSVTSKVTNKTSYHSNTESESDDETNIVKKHPENSVISKNIQEKTESKAPVVKVSEKISEAERKRKQSLSLMKNAYIQQKFAIKTALSSIVSKTFYFVELNLI